MLTTPKLNGGSGDQVGLGQAAHILHERGFKHRWQGVGPLSIKCFFRGQAFYDIEVGRYAVDDSSHLVLNEGQRLCGGLLRRTDHAQRHGQGACLSPNHFLRTFKQAFHQTPHQYLTRIRLEHAQGLLAQTNQPVTDVCFAVGFESLGSFSWLFRQRVGLAPEAYRRAKR
ncbi:MAG: helix-turn-helix transcriptional regulator [Pyrinomonadaceae bacterium]|nr:helix-turn-helix transcriptional regulator [Pyrinomonadaceae bacterium]